MFPARGSHEPRERSFDGDGLEDFGDDDRRSLKCFPANGTATHAQCSRSTQGEERFSTL